MSTEIERKFLVKQLPREVKILSTKEIEQTYLATGEEEVRIRKVIDKKIITYFHTIKVGTGLTRKEIETPISEATAKQLLKNHQEGFLSKLRMLVDYKGIMLEVDFYRQSPLRDLKVAEIEFSNEEEALSFQPFDWLGEDVTEDKNYKNQSLWEKVKDIHQ